MALGSVKTQGQLYLLPLIQNVNTASKLLVQLCYFVTYDVTCVSITMATTCWKCVNFIFLLVAVIATVIFFSSSVTEASPSYVVQIKCGYVKC